ncbi:hypothetical protein GIB67_036322 [Kingdonia uniflora]|uniref:ATP-dependent DNA ligase family profile domain-containing protein n=1 Tax=Kingdonia uniflora TaxID=39325 RepID=A0A7J7L3T4_9MAGN|nr:hypothetical protein GIB67_036322 [Kingdonia uniflora]
MRETTNYDGVPTISVLVRVLKGLQSQKVAVSGLASMKRETDLGGGETKLVLAREFTRNLIGIQRGPKIEVLTRIMTGSKALDEGETNLARKKNTDLKDLFNDEQPYKFEYAKEITVEAEDSSLGSEATLCKINSFLQDAFSSSCEGLIVKSLDVDARYVPSKRTNTWLKIKQDYMEGLNDTIDLVPIGAWHGNGRKAGWYSPFLMACYNPDTEEYQSVCRVMSGFSDSFYVEMREFFSSEKVLSKKPTYYHTDEVPDRWFSPELVWAIRGADFTVSPVHKAAIGLVHSSRGISIRFPRFIRPVSDRKAEDCSTAADISYMFQLQNRKMDIKGDD